MVRERRKIVVIVSLLYTKGGEQNTNNCKVNVNDEHFMALVMGNLA